MAILPICVYPHPALSAVAQPVAEITDKHRKTLANMAETMRSAKGVAIAANQVNVLDRLLVVDFDYVHKAMEYHGEDTTGIPHGLAKMVNPVLSEISEEVYVHSGEGCLSVPDVYTKIDRPAKLTLTYTDENNTQHTCQLTKLAAAAIHHEVDHLDGVLFLDRMGRVKRKMVEKKYDKARQYFMQYPRYQVLDTDGTQHEADLSGWKE